MGLSSPRLQSAGFRPAPIDYIGDTREWVRACAEIINELRSGKVNSRGEITLTANQTTTTLDSFYIGPKSHIDFTPTTANAAAEVGAGTMYVSSRGEKTATITHANNAQTDRTFTYGVRG